MAAETKDYNFAVYIYKCKMFYCLCTIPSFPSPSQGPFYNLMISQSNSASFIGFFYKNCQTSINDAQLVRINQLPVSATRMSAECRYAECGVFFIIILNVAYALSAIMLSSVIMLIVVAPNVIMLIVVSPNVIMLSVIVLTLKRPNLKLNS